MTGHPKVERHEIVVVASSVTLVTLLVRARGLLLILIHC
jgi:hypothetical protein